MSYDQILLFGDSITEQSFDQARGFGFGAAITHEYRRKLTVLHRGFGGYTTAHALHIINEIVPAPVYSSCIKLAIIFFGANDACLPGQPQHVPLATYRDNVRRLLTHHSLTAHPDIRILCVSPGPICEYKTQEEDIAKGKTCGIQRLAATTKQYAEAAMEVSAGLGKAVAGVDLWSAFMHTCGVDGGYVESGLVGSKDVPRNARLGKLLRDGLHFNPEGYEVMYEQVMKVALREWPELESEKMQFVHPHWEKAPRWEAEAAVNNDY